MGGKRAFIQGRPHSYQRRTTSRCFPPHRLSTRFPSVARLETRNFVRLEGSSPIRYSLAPPPPSSLSTSTSFSLPPPQPPLFSLYRCYLLAEKISSKFRDNGRRWVSERGRPRRKRPTNATNVTPMTTADRPFELVKRLGHRSANHLSLCRFNRSTARFFNRFTIRRDQLPFFVYTLCRYIYIYKTVEFERKRTVSTKRNSSPNRL